ncbi:MAG: sarcosine oxidase subunit gamma [Gammaproteobacteria bacterium]|nr:sarcosine oxidase subunit gamma [Gammaproteobacteria bacterium]
MADTPIVRVSPLATVKSENDVQAGTRASFNGLDLSERRGIAVVQVFARKGQIAEVNTVLGLTEAGTTPGVASVTERQTVLPLAPGQWMLTSRLGDDGSFASQLRQQLGNHAFVSEQSHGRVVIRVSGANARPLMQKGCRLDLHPSVAGAGFCAQTSMAQIGVLIHQLDDQPTYDLHVYSGFARSFWHWLTTSAAQFGTH